MFEIVKYLLDVFLKIAPDIAKHRASAKGDQVISALVDVLALIDALAIDAVRIDAAMMEMVQSTSDAANTFEPSLTLDELEALFNLQVSRLEALIDDLEKYKGQILIADDALRAELAEILDEKRGVVSRYIRFARVHGAQYSTLMLPAADTLHAGKSAAEEGRVEQWQVAVRAAPVITLGALVRSDAPRRQTLKFKSANTAALEEARARFRQGLIEIFGRERITAALGR